MTQWKKARKKYGIKWRKWRKSLPILCIFLVDQKNCVIGGLKKKIKVEDKGQWGTEKMRQKRWRREKEMAEKYHSKNFGSGRFFF